MRVLAVLTRSKNINAAGIRKIDSRIAHGSLYVALERLEELKLVESIPEAPHQHSGMPFRFYTITRRGKNVYKAWKKLNDALTS